MNTAVKMAAFAAVVATIFGGATVVGAAVGPIEVSGSAGGHDAMTGGSIALPRGLAVAEAGFRLAVESDTVTAAVPSTLAFRILGKRGDATMRFNLLHERPLHLIVLSRNLVDYLHLHPAMDAAGRWTVDLPALAAGSYRVFADFQPDGDANITLGADLSVPGTTSAVLLPSPAAVATVDGYTVSLTGTPSIGETELSFTVETGGQRVRTDPYLGAAGHLVAIRTGDLAYLHVHPNENAATPSVTFNGEFPTAGTYRLFFDFSHNGIVRTAAFTVVVPDGSKPTASGGH